MRYQTEIKNTETLQQNRWKKRFIKKGREGTSKVRNKSLPRAMERAKSIVIIHFQQKIVKKREEVGFFDEWEIQCPANF